MDQSSLHVSMENKSKYFFLVLTAILAVGCASQEDLLHADLWSGDPNSYIAKSNEDVRDLGKTPREKMLEQKKLDEKRRKSKSLKDDLIDGMIDGAIEELFDSK